VKFSKAKVAKLVEDGKAQHRDIAVPAFGYKNHASIDRRQGFVRGWNVTSASAYDGAQLRNVLNRGNTGSTVWADTAYRSKTNEAWLEKNGYVSDIHHKMPKGRPMSEATSRANGRRSRSAPLSSTSSRTRNPGWACSSGPSASPGPGRRS